MKRFALLFPAVVLAACGGNSNPPPAPAAPATEAQKALTPAAPAAVEQAPVAQPAAAQPVDVCAMLSRQDAEAVIGKLSKDPEPKPAQGSFLGGCDYMTEKFSIVSISARPASEFEQTVKYSSKTPPPEIQGLGGKAYGTGAGLMFQPDGKPYFIQIVAFGKGTETAAPEIARKLKP